MYRNKTRFISVLMLLFVCFLLTKQEETVGDLAQINQDPVANFIIMPFQYNLDFESDNHEPILEVYNIEDSKSRFRDSRFNLYTTSAMPHKVTFAYGLSLLLPTAMFFYLRSEKWSAGSAEVILVQPNRWPLGALTQNRRSFAGIRNGSDVKFFYAQIFTCRNISVSRFINRIPSITANWEANSKKQLTITLDCGFGRRFKKGQKPVKEQLLCYSYIEKSVNDLITSNAFGLFSYFQNKKMMNYET